MGKENVVKFKKGKMTPRFGSEKNMKIIWVTNQPLIKVAKCLNLQYAHNESWLIQTSDYLQNRHDIEFYLISPMSEIENIIEKQVDHIAFFGVPRRKAITEYDDALEKDVERILRMIEPDVVHVWGTELPHSLSVIKAAEKVGIADRVVFSIQGLVSIYERHYTAYLPEKVVLSKTLKERLLFWKYKNISKDKKAFASRGVFEKETLRHAKHVIGRTDWDEACAKMYNKEVKYHFCNETLRPIFYTETWQLNKCEKYRIFLSQCWYPIKGLHLMLEALPIILEQFPKTQAYVTGNYSFTSNRLKEECFSSYHKYLNRQVRNNHLEDHVHFLGHLDAGQMCEQYQKANVFVSASSIENSPNSVGEAMILGTPTISSDVGGVKNMMEHNKEGFIYPADEPYMLAYYIMKCFSSDELSMQLSANARIRAMKTHNPDENMKQLLNIYSLIGEGK